MRLGVGSPEMCATFMRFAVGQGRSNISMQGVQTCRDEAEIHTASVNENERIDIAMFQSFKMGWQEGTMRLAQHLQRDPECGRRW